MSVTLPPEITFGKVVGRWIRAVADTSGNVNELPEAVPASGTGRLTPVTKSGIRLDSTQNDGTYVGIMHEGYDVLLNADGEITTSVNPNTVGITVITGYYDVEMQLDGGLNWPKFTIEVTAANDATNPVDLIKWTPIEVTPTVQIVASMETAERAEAAALRAEAAADGMIVGGQIVNGELVFERNDMTIVNTGVIRPYYEGDVAPTNTDVLWADTSTPSLPETGNPYELRGDGSPEGVVAAPKATLYTDRLGTNGVWRWVKTTDSGSSGWVVDPVSWASITEKPMLPPKISTAWYGNSSGVGWALRQSGWHSNAEITGTHTRGHTTSATVVDSRCGYSWRFSAERFPVGSALLMRFSLPLLHDNTRNWVGGTVGGQDAALPFSSVHMSSRGMAFRASPYDGDTTFKLYVDGNLTDTGITIDTAWHEALFIKTTSGYTARLDNAFSHSFTTSHIAEASLVSITKDGVATRMALDLAWLSVTPGSQYYV